MAILEIPLTVNETQQPDPYFEQRQNLVTAAPSLPVQSVGHLRNTAEFSKTKQERPKWVRWSEGRINWMKIIPEFSPDGRHVKYDTPPQFQQFNEAIYQIAAYEHRNYPDARHASISMEGDQREVVAGSAQRLAKYHRDGTEADWRHVYIVSDTNPTEFLIFDQSTDARGVGDDTPGEPHVPRPYEIVMARGATFHRSPRIPETTLRTFLRVIYVHDLNPLEN